MTFDMFTIPSTTINGYLWSVMTQIEPTLVKAYGGKTPFFPISDATAGAKLWEKNPYFVYDRMMRITRKPFYPIKRDHVLYYLNANAEETLRWGSAVQYILDRQDDAAQDINSWNRAQASPANIYFHELRVYQSDAGDQGSPALTRDFSVRPKYITQFIVDAQYHFTDSLESILSS